MYMLLLLELLISTARPEVRRENKMFLQFWICAKVHIFANSQKKRGTLHCPETGRQWSGEARPLPGGSAEVQWMSHPKTWRVCSLHQQVCVNKQWLEEAFTLPKAAISLCENTTSNNTRALLKSKVLLVKMFRSGSVLKSSLSKFPDI